MTRISNLFERKKERVLNVYFTAGYPELESTAVIARTLATTGADMIEIGMPYSDPLADGPVIQGSSAVAIANGMTIAKLFDQLRMIRRETQKELTQMPIVLMGYLNPVLQYGFEKFCSDAAEAGVDGLILPDLPMFEFENEFQAIIQKHDLNFIFLVTPETSEQRVRKLDALSSGFLYAVSSSSTTGSEKSIDEIQAYLRRLQGYQLKNPVLVGFGIRDRQSFDAVSQFANGAIIGSAFIKALENSERLENSVKQFMNGILPSKPS